MRLVLKFKAEKIPADTSFFGLSIIKHALELGDREYYKQMFFRGNKKSKAIKPFVFDISYTKYTFMDKEIKIEGDCFLEVSSLSEEFLVRLFNGFAKMNEFNPQGYSIKKDSVFVKQDNNITSSKIIVNAKSCIVIKNRNNRYIDFNENPELYIEELNYISNECLKKYKDRELYYPIKIAPIKARKVVYKQRLSKDDTKGKFDVLYMNAAKGIFELKGHPEDLNELLKAGLGFKRAQGFGYIELIKEVK